MQKFSYSGRDSKGKRVTGVEEANTEKALAEQLLKKGITPLEIEEFKEKEDAAQTLSKKLNLSIGGPSLSDMSMLSRQMFSLTRAGVPILRAINVVGDSAKNPQLKIALKEIVAGIESGQSLAKSMATFPSIFPTLMIALVNVGENTGSLDTVFEQIAVHFEREGDTKKRIKTATRYPTMVIVAITVAIAVINMVVVPAFKGFFDKFGEALPMPTRILIATSDFTVNYWWLCLTVIVGSVVFWLSWIKTPIGRAFWDRWKLKLPLIGGIIERSLLARFSRSFALAVRSGVPLIDAINIVSKAADNVYVGSRIQNMRDSIQRGESLTHAADKSKMFTLLVIQMLSIGEETGEVDRLLDEVADFYEKELDYDLKRLGDAIEPILIVVIAIMVLILALGVFLPMWDISKVAMKG